MDRDLYDTQRRPRWKTDDEAGRSPLAGPSDVVDRVARFPGQPESAGVARHFVREMLQGVLDSDRIRVAMLLTGEFVTNSVLHARSNFDVRVAATDRTARVEVRDDSSDPPEVRVLTDDELNGRGLWLVELLATRWGWSPDLDGGGKVMWFELQR